jgi:O-antigen/teichoic acid export membrane protein
VSVNQPTARQCAICGGPVTDHRCTRCGAYASDLAQDDTQTLTPTVKRAAVVRETLLDDAYIAPPDQPTLVLPRISLNDARAAQEFGLDVTTKRPAMTDAGANERDELIKKSISGTKWIMVAILIGVPLGAVTQIVMGRISPTALGTYSLMTVLVQAIQTFFLFGGANVIVNFIPRASAKEKSQLLVSYASIALVFSIVFFVAMLIFPQALNFLLLHQTKASPTIYLFLLLFIPIVIGQTLTIAVLQGEMELGVAARTQYGVQVMSFVLAIALLLVLKLRLLPGSTDVALVPLVVLGAYITTFSTGLRALLRVMRRRWQASFRWHLPANFWSFTLTFHFNTIVFFFFQNIDQLYIAIVFNVTDVGIYRAALVVATYALWAPNLFTGAMYPFFTNLLARNEITLLKDAYKRYCAITGVMVAFVSVAAGLFAPQILLLFGKKYNADSLPLMVVFSLMYTVFASAAYVPSTALITAHEDIWLNLVLNVLSVGVRISLYVPLVGRFGLIGIAYANFISLGILYITTLIAVGLRYHVTVPLRQHLVSVAGGILLMAPYALEARHLLPSSTLIQLAVRALALLLFLVVISQLRLVSAADLAKVTGRLNKIPLLRRFLPKTA